MASASLDFQGAIRSGGLVLYPQFERPGCWFVLPHALNIGRASGGEPDFHIDLVRYADAGHEGYGVVDLRVVPVIDLKLAQAAVPHDTVEAAYFTGGWLRLIVRDPGAATTTTLLPPVPVASNGLGVVRLAAQLTPVGASLLKRALLEGAVLVDAWAEGIVPGIAPRLPATVTVQSADLIQALKQDLTKPVRRADLIAALAVPGVVAGMPQGADAAEAVADRLCALIGAATPSIDVNFAECTQLNLAANTQFRWDLNQPVPVTRTMPLRFDPIALVRQIATSASLPNLVTERSLAGIQTGFQNVLITANLPENRSPALTCGVDIVAEAKPPARLNAIRESVEFQPPADRQELVLRFAANEKPEYQYETFVVAETSSGIVEWRSEKKSHADNQLRLSVNDFAARFVPVSATGRLLSAGDLSITAQWKGASQTVQLTKDHAADSLVVPIESPLQQLQCRLTSGAREIAAIVSEPDAASIDLAVFREYGSHAVNIEIDFTGEDPTGMLALDLIADGADPSTSQTALFTPSKPIRTYGWFAASPFAPGFRYRLFQAQGAPNPWSAPQSPFDALRLVAKDLPTPVHV